MASIATEMRPFLCTAVCKAGSDPFLTSLVTSQSGKMFDTFILLTSQACLALMVVDLT